MRWMILAAVALVLAGIGAYSLKPELFSAVTSKPMTRDERALFACQEVVKEVLRSPTSMELYGTAGTWDEGEDRLHGQKIAITKTVFEFTSKNSYGTDVRGVGACKFGWSLVGGVRGTKPFYIEGSLNGKLPDELTNALMMSKALRLKFPGD